MTNHIHYQPNQPQSSSTIIKGFRWLHNHPTFILVVAGVVMAVIVATHLDLAQILTNPAALIVGGIGLVVALHLAGVSLFAFWAQKRRVGRLIASHNHGPSQHAHQGDHDHHPHPHQADHIHADETIQTRGEVIRWGAFYDRFINFISLGQEKSLRHQTVDLAQIQPGDTVLDVGCGTGSLALVAKAQVGPTGEVVGLDPASEMIDVARQKAATAGLDITFQVDVIENIPFPDNHFEVVLSTFMMHHLPEDLKVMGLSEIYRVLKPGGRVLIVDIESSTDGSFVRNLSDIMVQLHGGHTVLENNVKQLAPLIEEAGFVSVQTTRLNRQISSISGQKGGNHVA